MEQLSDDPTEPTLLLDKANSQKACDTALFDLEAINIKTLDLLKGFKDIELSTIQQSNKYYAKLVTESTVENLVWSSSHVLNTCDISLRDKVREGLVNVSLLEARGLLVLKKKLEIIMGVDDSSLHSLTQLCITR